MAILEYFPEKAKRALSTNASGVIAEIGADVIKEVVLNVLMGDNIRNNTELLTRKRLLTLNAAALYMLVAGKAENPEFISSLHHEAYLRLMEKGLKKEEKWILQWILGLNDKAYQNVLRGNAKNLQAYKDDYADIIGKSVAEFEQEYGKLEGTLKIKNLSAPADWEIFAYLLTMIGSQTLSIRGSDKSTFGKLFEKLVLGSLLSILGFRQVDPQDIGDGKKVFWLSERQERRESDATILFEKGKGVRFDIGFIGPGNPEISLDKVSRFERELEIDATKYYMATIIVIDRIGAGSRIERLAEKIDGHIVQMSGAYWPKKVAQLLHQRVGYSDPILSLEGVELHEALSQRLDKVNFNELVKQGFDK